MDRTDALTDVRTLRKRARQHIDDGAVTSGYGADRATLLDMVKEDLVAERIAIDSYRDVIRYLEDRDPTTRRMLESNPAVEEEHADELADLLQDVPSGRGQAARSSRSP